ncbi:hypothetical protein ABWH92_01990 [Ahrensia marina]|uniref:hypothetical protein n=1 Tax=Ahrensia marina TaxID=1514904 RepID=UPI0035D106F7
MTKSRYSFGVTEGYVEPKPTPRRSPAEAALPAGALVSNPAERADFLAGELQQATKEDRYVTAPSLADKFLASKGVTDISASQRKRQVSYVRDWLRKQHKRGLVERVKDMIGTEYPGTDGWRWAPSQPGGAASS